MPSMPDTFPAMRRDRPSTRARITRALLLVLGTALLGYLAARLGFRQIVSMLADLKWTFLPVLLLYAGHQALRAAALGFCLPRRGTVAYADLLAVRLSGEAVQFLTFSGPVLAEPMKAWLLRKRGLTTWEGLAATLAEYLASSMMAAAMAIVGLAYVLIVIEPTGGVRIATLAVLSGMVVFAGAFVVGISARLHIIGAFVRLAARLPWLRERLQHRLEGVGEAEDLLIHVLRDSPRRLWTILGIEAAGQACLGLELFCLIAALHPSSDLGQAMLIEGATKFITAGYFFVPGQVGVAEGTYAVIFNTFAIPAAAGFAVSFVRRVRSVLTATIGLSALSRSTRLSEGSTPARS